MPSCRQLADTSGGGIYSDSPKLTPVRPTCRSVAFNANARLSQSVGVYRGRLCVRRFKR